MTGCHGGVSLAIAPGLACQENTWKSGDGKTLMQLRDAAEMLGVHYQTAYAWVREGVLPARKTGRGYEVSEGDVSALAARRA